MMQLCAVQNNLYACNVLFKVTVHSKDRIQVMQSYPLQDPDAKLLKTFFSSYCIWLIGRHSRLLHWQISICLWACHLSDQQVGDSCLCFSTHLNLISYFFVHLSLLFTFRYYKGKSSLKLIQFSSDVKSALCIHGIIFHGCPFILIKQMMIPESHIDYFDGNL